MMRSFKNRSLAFALASVMVAVLCVAIYFVSAGAPAARAQNPADPEISITIDGGDSATVSENAGTPIIVTLNADVPTASDLAITLDFYSNTNLADDEYDVIGNYRESDGIFTFPSNQTQATFEVSIHDDSINEADEVLAITIKDGDDYDVATQKRVTITVEDDDPPTLSLTTSVAVFTEGDRRARTAKLTATRTTQNLEEDLWLDLEVEATTPTVTGRVGSRRGDYTTSPLIYIPVGLEQGVAYLTINDDSIAENTETLTVRLANAPAEYEIDPQRGAVSITILDDDIPSISISGSGDINEGDMATLTIRSDLELERDVVVRLETGTGSTATADDFAFSADSVTLNADSNEQTITISAIDDTHFEPTEALVINLATGTDYRVSNGTATFRIFDNDIPTIDISTATGAITEGRRAQTVPLTLTRTGDPNIALSVALVVEGISGVITDSDYDLPQTITIPAGTTQATANLTINSDNVDEETETLLVRVASGKNYTLGTASTTITITIADDPRDMTRISLDYFDDYVVEGDYNIITVNSTRALERELAVDLLIGVGSAADYADVQFAVKTVTFPNDSRRSASTEVEIDAIDDDVDEATNERLVVEIAPGDYLTGTRSIAFDIEDNDTTELSISAKNITEGETGTVFITTSKALGRDVSVNLALTDDTADASDYTALTTTATLPNGTGAGESVAVAVFSTADDSAVEADETVLVSIVPNSDYATSPTQNSATISIIDDDTPQVSISANKNTAYESTTPSMRLVVLTLERRGGDISAPLTVNLVRDTANSSSTISNNDYRLYNAVTIPAHATRHVTLLRIVDDAIDENDETLTVRIQSDSNYEVDAEHNAVSIVIMDNDTTEVSIGYDPIDRISVENRWLSAGKTEGSEVEIRVVTSLALERELVVPLRVGADSTATVPSDASIPSSVTFPLGSNANSIQRAFVRTHRDSLAEPNEVLRVNVAESEEYNALNSSVLIPIIGEIRPTVSLRVVENRLRVGEMVPVIIERTGSDLSLPLYGIHLENNVRLTAGDNRFTIPANESSIRVDLGLRINSSARDVITTIKVGKSRYYTASDDAVQLTFEAPRTATRIPSSLPEVSIYVGGNNTIAEGQAVPIVAMRSGGDISQPLTVRVEPYSSYSLDFGRAYRAGDIFLSYSPSSIIIPANSVVGTTVAISNADTLYEGDEGLTVRIIPHNSYYITPSYRSVQITIVDNNTPSVEFSGVSAVRSVGANEDIELTLESDTATERVYKVDVAVFDSVEAVEMGDYTVRSVRFVGSPRYPDDHPRRLRLGSARDLGADDFLAVAILDGDGYDVGDDDLRIFTVSGE